MVEPTTKYSAPVTVQKNLLLVDDSIDELRILVAMLKSAGYRMIVSNNGADGVARAALLAPDLILLDIRMAQMDGFAVCRQLKVDHSTRHIPVIFLTAANDPNSRLDGLRLGAVDYIVKPPIEEEVLLRVGIHLHRAKERLAQEDGADAGGTDAREIPIPVPQNAPRTVLVACRLVVNDPGKSWTLDSLSSMVGTHRKRLSEEFRMAMGITVMAWVREYRLQLAAKWLRNSDMRIHSIAYDLCYDSPANFSTAFRERFGAPPSEYRQALRV